MTTTTVQKTCRSTVVPFARPSIGPEEERAVLNVLRSGWLTTGRITMEFERAFASEVGVRHALAVNSGTAGLHLALRAIGLAQNTYVITTPYTFTATAEVVRYGNAHVRFVDIKPGTFNIDEDLLDRELRSDPDVFAAVIPVHIGGLPCNMEAIRTSAERTNVPVVEDAAHAFPSMTRLGYAGTIGNAGVYSFYANKTITTGEGGMLVTNDDEIARTAATLRLHGIDRDVWDRYRKTDGNSWEYDVVAPGYKYNVTDLASAIGLEQLKKAEDLLQRRRRIALRYNSALGGMDFLTIPPDGEGNAWHLYVIRLNLERLSIDRNGFISSLAEAGVGTSVHYKPLHLMRYYRQTYGFRPHDFPVALQTFQEALSLPIYPDMTDEQIEHVISAVLNIGHAHRKRSAL